MFGFKSGTLRLESAHPLQETRKRLQKIIQKHRLIGIGMRKGLTEAIHGNLIRASYHTPMFQNSFRPVFHGSLLEKNGLCYLEGNFSIYRFVIPFVIFFMGFSLYMTIDNIITGFMEGVMIGVLMLIFMPVLVTIGQKISAKEKSRILELMSLAIACESPGQRGFHEG